MTYSQLLGLTAANSDAQPYTEHFPDTDRTVPLSTLASAWDTWYSASELACRGTAAAWHHYHRLFLSPAAVRRYEWAGKMIALLGILAFLYGRMARNWCDRLVEESQISATLEPVEEMAIGDASEPIPATPAHPALVEWQGRWDRMQSEGAIVQMGRSGERVEMLVRRWRALLTA